MTSTLKALFPLGQIVATPGALSALGDEGITPDVLISRHVSRDWGDMTQEDKDENEANGRKEFPRDLSSTRWLTSLDRPVSYSRNDAHI